MDIARLVLEYLKVFLSVQVVVGAVAAIFLGWFRTEIAHLIDRIFRIKFPGGEVTASQSQKTAVESATFEKPPAVSGPPQTDIPENLSLTPDQAKKIEELLQSERAKACLWEYRYLNFYLVHNTQRILDWLASLNQRTTLGYYDSLWIPFIPSAEERQAIINALRQHHLIILDGELIEVTLKGREYIGWRGLWPNVPAQGAR